MISKDPILSCGHQLDLVEAEVLNYVVQTMKQVREMMHKLAYASWVMKLSDNAHYCHDYKPQIIFLLSLRNQTGTQLFSSVILHILIT